ncbi:MAG: hypothetical protein A2287_04950 [Candidatus Melainabacteria bacterium RIFOXYA12_FULL_32_12]|nr:MAG: hypothetical protein A2104_04215 [Candidatus Melainabacteria bacterium GWF2_32_7]OGI23444.1 MAG: hypothetical protein A2255_00250 [Candidatus Melainabacteria bacterium RIFOXYA2_FULL_32_9]OGI29967.1 MAG: hypothetical protein A2287_04950 [Candidatus Melainabacteria bacterium RIFOXYA12_FULL_32_12]
MGAGYTTLIVTDRQNDVVEIQSKLTISRTMDVVISCTLDKTVEYCRKNFPDVVIIFAHERTAKLFEVCKILRLDSLLKHIPIIFIYDRFNEEFVIESLNAGVSDYVIAPIKKVDILAHLNWAFEKSKLMREIEIKEELLKDLGVVDRNIGAYLPKYVHIGFNSHINIAKKYKYPLVFMMICIDSPYKNKINNDYLAKVLKKTLRSTDAIGFWEQGNFHILLPKTDLKGVHTLHNKIVANLGNNFTISVGICMHQEGINYESLKDLALKALSDAISNGGNRVCVYNVEQVKADSRRNLSQQNQEKESESLKPELSKSWIGKIQTSKRSYESFKKEFIKRINNLVSPTFYKVSNKLKQKYPTSIIIDYSATDAKCEFSIKEIYDGTENILQIVNPGLDHLKIERCLIKAGKQTLTRYNIELDDLTETYIERILLDLFNEFEIISDIERLCKERENNLI